MSPRLFIIIISCLLGICANAQKGSLKGVIKDSASSQPLSLASVTVFSAADTVLITYRLSGSSGEFTVPDLPLDRLCRLVISFQGFRVYRKEFQLHKEKQQIDLGIISLAEDSKALDEILISAERPPMMMRNDTLEFNANAFKTLPTALVEDLLKKLPGVDIDLQGNMMVNGRTVNRLLVDGKEFFGTDYRIATRNLPANIVDKVQVTDDAEQKRKNPRIQNHELGQVVNIKLKRAIRQGWFGKVYGGAGTNKRHEAGGIVNLFRDTVQVSVLGFSNNVNKPGFEMDDLQKVGGTNRGGDEFMNEFSTGGIQHSRGGGLNFNNEFGKNLKANFNYLYKQNNGLEEGRSFMQQFLEDTVLLSPSANRSESIEKEHKIGGSLRWQIDSMTSLDFRPGLAIGNNEDRRSDNSFTSDNFKGLVNRNDNRHSSTSKSYRYQHSLSFFTSSGGKRNRSLNISQSTSLSNTDYLSVQEGTYTFFNNNIGQDSLLNLRRSSNGLTVHNTVDLNFSQSMADWFQVSLQHNVEHERNTNSTDVFNKFPGTDQYTLYNDPLSNGVKKQGWKQTSTADLSFTYKNWEFSPTLNLLWLRNTNQFPKSPAVYQRLFFAYPSFKLRWKALNLSYDEDVSPTDAGDLRTIIDISDPLYKRYGNPDLQPTIRQILSFHFFHYFQGSGSNLSLSLYASREKNGTIELTLLDSNRIQLSRPINIDGATSYSVNGTYSKQFKFGSRFWLSLRPQFTGSMDDRFVSINGFMSKASYKRGRADLHLSLRYHDIMELNQRYRLQVSQSRYEDKKNYRDADQVTHQFESAIVLRWPRLVVWENQVNYSFNPQVGPGIRTSLVRWNTNIFFAFTKDEKAQLKLSVHDLLNQNVDVHRYNSEGIISDYQGMTLGRYSMISLVYNIRYFGSGRKSGSLMN